MMVLRLVCDATRTKTVSSRFYQLPAYARYAMRGTEAAYVSASARPKRCGLLRSWGLRVHQVGRSGTGKTSIAVGRMWELYRHWHENVKPISDEPYHQVFVTANKVLRDQVANPVSLRSSYTMRY
eukprot:1008438-Rhodomonas_salina.7